MRFKTPRLLRLYALISLAGGCLIALLGVLFEAAGYSRIVHLAAKGIGLVAMSIVPCILLIAAHVMRRRGGA